MEEAEEADVQLDQISGITRDYLDSLVQTVRKETGENSDSHKYHHYMLEKFKEKWTDDEKKDEQKVIQFQEFACPRTCKFCGCVRRTLKIRTKRVKRVKRKFYFLFCRFCGKSILINKVGSRLSRVAPIKVSDESTTEPKSRKRTKPKSKPIPESKRPKLDVVPITRPTKIEKFNQDDTIKRLNFLLKGGNGGKKLSVNQLQKSKLMDLLM